MRLAVARGVVREGGGGEGGGEGVVEARVCGVARWCCDGGTMVVAVCVGEAGRCGGDGGLEARAGVLPRAEVVSEAAAVRASQG